jgi:hypothetical protein
MAHYTFVNLNFELVYDCELRRIYPVQREEIILVHAAAAGTGLLLRRCACCLGATEHFRVLFTTRGLTERHDRFARA